MRRILIMGIALAGCLEAGQKDFYLGINPVALMTAIDTRTSKLLCSIFSNAEYGLSLNAGCFLDQRSALEARLVLGSPHDLDFSFMPQLHACYNFFLRNPTKLPEARNTRTPSGEGLPLEGHSHNQQKSQGNNTRNTRNKGFYFGANLRFWDMYYSTSRNHYFNIAPAIDAGYMWNIGKLFMDLRLNQMFAVLTWSSQEHTSPALKFFISPIPEFSPVVGLLSFNIGFKF